MCPSEETKLPERAACKGQLGSCQQMRSCPELMGSEHTYRKTHCTCVIQL